MQQSGAMDVVHFQQVAEICCPINAAKCTSANDVGNCTPPRPRHARQPVE
jgi:hypothetical protein